MASPAPVSGGTNQSMWANQPATRGGWGRDGDPGSAFRGIGRGRPGGRGSARGGGRGRGGFRGGTSNREDTDRKAGPDSHSSKPALDSTKATANTSSSPTTTGPKTSSRPPRPPRPSRKPSEHKPARKVPTVVVDTVPPSENTSASSLPNRPTAQRRRSQTPNKPIGPAPMSKSLASAESSTASVATGSSVTKDIPPHLAIVPNTPSFDIKHDIDALVERVRAVAMDRPNTPGNHIDWARDDDEDSLPDLDDWGLTSSTSVTEPKTASVEDSIISPILEGTLKPLPSVEAGTPSSIAQIMDNANDHPAPAKSPSVIDTRNDSKQLDTLTVPDKPKARRGSHTKTGRAGLPEMRSNVNNGGLNPGVAKEDLSKLSTSPRNSARAPSPKVALKAPLHPSLPPKPEMSPDFSSAKRQPRNGTTEKAQLSHAALPPKPITAETTSEVKEKEVVQETSAPVPPASVPQPEKADSAAEDLPAQDTTPPDQGLMSSMHAPLFSSASTPTGPSSLSVFNPSHGRSRTLGRPPGHPAPHSTNGSGLSDSLSDSGHGGRASLTQHLRTQSTPPSTGAMHVRAHSRPVITGDAISRLARTLGGVSPRREVTAAKE